MRRLKAAAALLGLLALLSCTRTEGQARAVYVLLDVSGSYVATVNDALRATKLVLTRLEPNDSISVARIEACSFSDAAVLVRARLEDRPSAASAMKSAVAHRLDSLLSTVRPAQYSDITGAIYQAAQSLRDAPQANRYLVIFSDLEEDLPHACQRGNLPGFDLKGIHVIAADVTRLPSDNRSPARYTRRLEAWRKFALNQGAAEWRVVDDPVELADLVTGRNPG